MWSLLEQYARERILPKPLEPGQDIGGIRITRRVGSDSHSNSYTAVRDGQRVVVSQFASTHSSAFLAWQNETRFASNGCGSAFHHACAEWDGGLVFPLLTGVRLTAIRKLHPITRDTVLQVGIALARTLFRLHSQGVVHHHLHPGNLLWDAQNGSIVLTGFGFSSRKGWDDLWNDSVSPLPPPGYRAPECSHQNRHVPGRDVFGLGATLFSLVCRVPPVPASWGFLPSSLYVSFLRRNAREMPEFLLKIIAACLDPDPRSRPLPQEIARSLGDNDLLQDPPEACNSRINGISPAPEREKVMIFLRPDSALPSLLHRARKLAEARPAALLFVSLIPVNMAAGEVDFYKGTLFRHLGPELARCREKNLTWGLRVLDDVDVNRTAALLARLYGPHRIIAGAPLRGGLKATLQPGLTRKLVTSGFEPELVDGTSAIAADA